MLKPYNIKGSKSLFFLFLIWPFLAFLFALRSYHQKQSKIITWLFLGLYGFTFIIYGEGMDGFAYASRLEFTAGLPFRDFFQIVGGLYAVDSSVDIMEPLMRFIVSRFTSDSRFLFLLFALVFGYFQLKSVDLLHNSFREHRNINAWIFLWLFVFINPIFNINGVRMWTAAWVFFLGAYHVVLYMDKKYLWLSLFAALFHFSFLAPNLILFIYYFSGNRNKIFYPILIASFILPEFELVRNFIQQAGDLLGGSLEQRVITYTRDATLTRMERAAETRRWFLTIPFLRYYLIFAVGIAHFLWKKYTRTRELQNLYSFLLLFLSFANFIRVLLYDRRFYPIFFTFATAYLFHAFINKKARKLNWLTVVGIFPIILTILISFRIMGPTISTWLFGPSFLIFIAPPTSPFNFVL